MWSQKPVTKAELPGIGLNFPAHQGSQTMAWNDARSPRNDNSVVSLLLAFFGLTRQPFGVTPDPSLLYLGQTHREALASLIYGIESGLGFLSLIGKPGMGKTTLLFSVLDKFRDSARTAFLFQTQCSSRELMQSLISELGYEASTQDFVRMTEEFNGHLLREVRAGKRFIVIVDEAQNLDPSVLETVRLLSNFETPHAKLLQIVLAGQQELAEKLASQNMLQLRQRVSLVNRLQPLSPEDVRQYIQHRLRLCGYTGQPLLTSEALSILLDFAEGIPRNINNFCFNALSLAFTLQSKVVDGLIAREVVTDLDVSGHVSKLNSNAEKADDKHLATTVEIAKPLTPDERAVCGSAIVNQFPETPGPTKKEVSADLSASQPQVATLAERPHDSTLSLYSPVLSPARITAAGPEAIKDALSRDSSKTTAVHVTKANDNFAGSAFDVKAPAASELELASCAESASGKETGEKEASSNSASPPKLSADVSPHGTDRGENAIEAAEPEQKLIVASSLPKCVSERSKDGAGPGTSNISDCEPKTLAQSIAYLKQISRSVRATRS